MFYLNELKLTSFFSYRIFLVFYAEFSIKPVKVKLKTVFEVYFKVLTLLEILLEIIRFIIEMLYYFG